MVLGFFFVFFFKGPGAGDRNDPGVGGLEGVGIGEGEMRKGGSGERETGMGKRGGVEGLARAGVRRGRQGGLDRVEGGGGCLSGPGYRFELQADRMPGLTEAMVFTDSYKHIWNEVREFSEFVYLCNGEHPS